MRRLRIGLNVLLLGLLLSGTVLASDVSDATNEGTITVSNSGSAVSNVAAVFSLTSSEWVDNGYFDSDYDNVAIQAGSGSDVAFMPGASTWCMYAGSLGATSSTDFSLYTGGATDMEGKLRCFPGDSGMTASDAASLELGNNFEVLMSGLFDTSSGGALIDKDSAFDVKTVDDDIVAKIGGAPDRSTSITPATGSWQDVDVSAYVPDGATGVIVEYVGNYTSTFAVRPNGSTDDISSSRKHGHGVGFMSIDGDDVFECKLSGGSLYLLGYTTSWGYLSSVVDVSPAVLNSWEDVDVSAHVPDGTVAVVLDVVNTAGSTVNTGLRENGISTGTAYYGMQASGHSYAIVGLDSNEVFEAYISNAGCDCYLLGYISSGYTSLAAWSDQSLPTTGSYQTMDLNSVIGSGSVAALFDVNGYGQLYDYDLRGYGETTSYSEDAGAIHHWFLVPCSSDRKVSGFIGHTSQDWFVTGYFTSGVVAIDSGVEATAADILTGDHTVKVTADGTNLKIYVDDILKDTTALGGASVSDNSSDWQYCTGGSCLYLESLETKVGGVTKQLIDFADPPGAGGVYHDDSGNSNDVTASLRTTASDPDVTADITSFEPAAPAEAGYVSNDEAGEMLPGAPTEPEGMYEELEVDHLPGAEVVNALLDAGEIPRAIFWFPFAFTLSLVIALAVYYFSRSLLATSIAMGTALAFMSRCGILPFWVVIPFALIAVAVLIKERTVRL